MAPAARSMKSPNRAKADDVREDALGEEEEEEESVQLGNPVLHLDHGSKLWFGPCSLTSLLGCNKLERGTKWPLSKTWAQSELDAKGGVSRVVFSFLFSMVVGSPLAIKCKKAMRKLDCVWSVDCWVLGRADF